MDELASAIGADRSRFAWLISKMPRACGNREGRRHGQWKPGQQGDGSRGRGIGFARYKIFRPMLRWWRVSKWTAPAAFARAAGLGGNRRRAVISPDGLTNQIEGGIIQSASWTLYEEVQFDKSGILTRDWSRYPIMTMLDVPKVTVELSTVRTNGRLGREKLRRDRRSRRSPTLSLTHWKADALTADERATRYGGVRQIGRLILHRNVPPILFRRNHERNRGRRGAPSCPSIDANEVIAGRYIGLVHLDPVFRHAV
jgi:hypothetical protein